MKTKELTGVALDWSVAKCEGVRDDILFDFVDGEWLGGYRKYSTDWAQGGEIIEREKIEFKFHHVVVATIWYRDGIGSHDLLHKAIGKTPLEAAMRCYVISKLGDDIELPAGLK